VRPRTPSPWGQLAAIALGIAVLPFFMPGGSLELNLTHWNRLPLHAGFVDLATTVLVFSLFALGFNMLFGHTGELSFGHAMFFAIAAYSTALYTKGFDVALGPLHLVHGAGGNALIALLVSLALVLAWAFLLARIIVPRSSGIYYSMITMAFAQVIYFIAFRWSDLTGGEDGIQAVARPALPGLPADWLGDSSGTHFFIFAAVVTFAAVVANYWILHSPFGSVLHAIRENKQRARFLGYDVDKYRVNAFVLSTVFPAVGGWLWTYFQQSINPDAGSIDYSGRVVMMSLLGGIGAFVGPMIGAFAYWDLQNSVSQITKYWPAAIGGVFVVFVLAAPRGIAGAFGDLRRYGVTTAVRRWFSPQARLQTDLAKEAAVKEAGQ
jgi:ABC-type branched-subunit amino acid transport system permease subunit